MQAFIQCHVLEGDRLGKVQLVKVGRKTSVEFPCASDDAGGVCVLDDVQTTVCLSCTVSII